MSSNEHPLREEELMAYVDEQLPPTEAQRVAAHLAYCADCARAVSDAKEVSLKMAQWEVESVPDRLAVSVLAALPPKQSDRKARGGILSSGSWWSRSRPWTYGLGGAAAVLALVAFVMTPSLLRSRQASMGSNGEFIDQLGKEGGAVSPEREKASKRVDEGQFAFELSQLDGQGQGQGQGQGLASQLAQRTEFEKLSEAKQSSSQAQVATLGPMVIRTVSLSMETKDFPASRNGIEAMVKRYQGYVDHLSVRDEAGSARGLSATLRLPADRVDAGLSDLRKLGRVNNESQNSADVTSQYADLEARLNNARNTEQRLLALLRDRTGRLSDVVAAEREVSRVREEIERMEAQRKNMTNQVQYSTIQVELAEEYRAQLETPTPSVATRIRNAGVEGLRLAFETVLGAGLTLLAYGPAALLWILLLGSFGAALWFLGGRWIAKRS